jgi:hypothetical protein
MLTANTQPAFHESFEEAAAEPARCRAAIADYAKRRRFSFWCAVASSVCALAAFAASGFADSRRGAAGVIAGMGFAAAMIWTVAIKLNSDFRVLKAFDQRYKDRAGRHVN